MENTNQPLEIWKDIVGYEGYYQISNYGRVKSLERWVTSKNGVKKPVKETILKPCLVGKKKKYCSVGLRKENKSKNFKIHSLVAVMFLNHTPCGLKLVVDHIDNNQYNNNLSNLQIITQRKNSSKDKKGGTSKYIGVCFKRNKWDARIYINSKRIHLGTFDSEEKASLFYENALKNYELGIPIIDNKIPKSSSQIGVCWDKSRNKWKAEYFENKKAIYIGRFNTEKEAINAYINFKKSKLNEKINTTI